MVVGKERTCEISRSAYEAAVTYESEGERAIRLDFSRDSDDLDDDEEDSSGDDGDDGNDGDERIRRNCAVRD